MDQPSISSQSSDSGTFSDKTEVDKGSLRDENQSDLEHDLGGSLKRKYSQQSFTFECEFDNEANLNAIVKQIHGNRDMAWNAWSKTKLFISMNKKKTVTYFTRTYPLLKDIKIVKFCSITEKEQIGGKKIVKEASNNRTEFQSGRNKDPTLNGYFRVIKETGVVPTDENDIDMVLNKKVYADLSQTAIQQLIKKHFRLELRPWQKAVVNLLDQQNDRQFLWVFDPKGGAGKTKLGQYLVLKKNYQLLTPSDEHHCAGVIEAGKEGYIIDLGRDTFGEGGARRTSSMYLLIEKMKDGFVLSVKYQGTYKFIGRLDNDFQMIAAKIVIFSNTMPNIAKMTLDRWVVFHPRLGKINLKETSTNSSYCCSITNEEGHQLGEDLSALIHLEKPVYKDENVIINEYLENVLKNNIRLVYRNKLAFPLCTTYMNSSTMKRLLSAAWQARNFNELLSFCERSNCLAGSIVSLQSFKSFLESLYIPPNDGYFCPNSADLYDNLESDSSSNVSDESSSG